MDNESVSTDHRSQKKAIVDIVTIFDADGCRFLGTKEQLFAFRRKLCAITENTTSCTDSDNHTATVFEILQESVDCVLNETSKWINSTEETLPSIEDSKLFHRLLKYVCAFFLDPYLEVATTRNKTLNIPICYSLSLKERYTLLLVTVTKLCHSSEKNEVFRNILMQSYSTYTINALLQLCFSPASIRNLNLQQRKVCLNYLNSVTTKWISKERLVEDSIIIQGTLSKNPPSWLVKKCGAILSKILLDKNGVKTVIMVMVSHFKDGSSESGESWERIVALSSILSTLPSSGYTEQDYCELVGAQLVEMLVTSQKTTSSLSKDVIRIAITTIHALHEKYPEESQCFENLICTPLMRLECNSVDSNGNVWDDLTECIEILHQVCASVGVAPSSLIQLLLKPYVKILFHFLIKIPASNYIRPLILDLIQAILKKTDRTDASNIIIRLFSSIKDDAIKEPAKNLNFVYDDKGEISIDVSSNTDPSKVLEDLDFKVQTILDIMMDIEIITSDVFLLLIKNLCNQSKNVPHQIQPNKILSPAERSTEALELNEERFIMFGLLSSMIETCDPNVLLTDTCQVLEFIKTTLVEIPNKLPENTADSVEILKLCASVVGICMVSTTDLSHKQLLQEIVTALKCILDTGNYFDSQTRELLSDLIITISTYGAVNNVRTSDFSETMREYLRKLDCDDRTSQDASAATSRVTKASHSTPENLTVNSLIPQQNRATETMSGSKARSVDEKSFCDALNEIHSRSPALKGGSIMYLTKCVSEELPSAIAKIHKLIELFMECLDDNDSYVYLAAVQGLNVISAKNDLFVRIVEEFSNDDKSDSEDGIVSKMKLGEIITRIIRDMGDTAARHASVLLPMLLKFSKHSDNALRASVLSNLAELAPMVPHVLLSLQFEIKECLCGISVSDTDPMVRRAACYAIRQLVTRLSDNILKIFPNTISDMYKILKQLYRSDEDNEVQLHAQLALEELDNIMRSALFKLPQLSKKITILP